MNLTENSETGQFKIARYLTLILRLTERASNLSSGYELIDFIISALVQSVTVSGNMSASFHHSFKPACYY